jgi:hypothetical protein
MILATDKQKYRINHSSSKFISKSLMYFNNNLDRPALSVCFDLQDKMKTNVIN